MTKRVTKTKLRVQQANVRAQWAMYCRACAEQRHALQNMLAGRPNTRTTDLKNTPEDYGRWHQRAVDKLDRLRVM